MLESADAVCRRESPRFLATLATIGSVGFSRRCAFGDEKDNEKFGFYVIVVGPKEERGRGREVEREMALVELYRLPFSRS